MNTVLIVDDDQDDIELAKIALNMARPEVMVKVAVNGEAALHYLRNGGHLTALILLDLKMCGMSGAETLREIRADATLNKIPVVVVTSSSLQTDEEEAYAAGANGYLHKAINLNQFSKDIKSIVDRWVPN